MKQHLRVGLVATGVLTLGLSLATAAVAEEWGAIAVDLGKFERDPYHGIGGGDSEKEAVANSMKFCRESGGPNCKLVVTYNACGAYAASRSDGAWGKGQTKKEAESRALANCSGGCKLVVADCN